MAAFREVLFPPSISYGSSGGPKFKTTIFTADSGYEQRNVDWANQRAEYNVSHGIKNQSQMDELTNFFYAVARGRAYGFRFLDYNDYKIAAQDIGTGDSAKTQFQFFKTYTFTQSESSETDTFTRTLRKIAWNTVAGVTVGGVIVTQSPDLITGQKWTMDYNTGIMTLQNAPAVGAHVIIGAAQFHVPGRFDTDHLDVTQEF